MYLWIAGLACIFGLVFIFVELRSPDLVIWNGHCVPAFFDGGVAHYRVGGQPFTADNPPLLDRTPRTVTVCYYPDQPAVGYIVHPAAYWVEGGLMFGPLALGLVLFIVGMLTSWRRLMNPPQLPPLPGLSQTSG